MKLFSTVAFVALISGCSIEKSDSETSFLEPQNPQIAEQQNMLNVDELPPRNDYGVSVKFTTNSEELSYLSSFENSEIVQFGPFILKENEKFQPDPAPYISKCLTSQSQGNNITTNGLGDTDFFVEMFSSGGFQKFDGAKGVQCNSNPGASHAETNGCTAVGGKNFSMITFGGKLPTELGKTITIDETLASQYSMYIAWNGYTPNSRESSLPDGTKFASTTHEFASTMGNGKGCKVKIDQKSGQLIGTMSCPLHDVENVKVECKDGQKPGWGADSCSENRIKKAGTSVLAVSFKCNVSGNNPTDAENSEGMTNNNIF